jgi:hypothetical protein
MDFTSFIYTDEELLAKLIKCGQEAPGPTITDQGTINAKNAENLRKLITDLIGQYDATSGQQGASGQPATQQKEIAASAKDLEAILPFNYNFVSFANIEHFLDNYASFTNHDPGVTNIATEIKQSIMLAKGLLRMPTDLIELGEADDFSENSTNPIVLLQYLQHIISDTAGLYRQCILRLSGLRDSNTRSMSQNIESAKANLDTFGRLKTFVTQHLQKAK